MAKKRTNPEKYKMQKVRTAGNKRRSWLKHMEKNPNDAVGKAKLEQLIKDQKSGG